MRWYLQNRGYQTIEDVFRDEVDPVNAHAITALIDHLEPRYRARQEARNESKVWRRLRLKALDEIAEAAEAWRQAHLDAATVLRECGGLRSLRFSCGNYTAANLKLAADRIQIVISATGPDETDAAEGNE